MLLSRESVGEAETEETAEQQAAVDMSLVSTGGQLTTITISDMLINCLLLFC